MSQAGRSTPASKCWPASPKYRPYSSPYSCLKWRQLPTWTTPGPKQRICLLQLEAASTLERSNAMACFGSSAPNTAVPATITLAPAAAAWSTVLGASPPSTCAQRARRTQPSLAGAQYGRECKCWRVGAGGELWSSVGTGVACWEAERCTCPPSMHSHMQETVQEPQAATPGSWSHIQAAAQYESEREVRRMFQVALVRLVVQSAASY